ncbi:hypothetical protein CEUSTIGMA_g5379.t1 [Chlamydomonas eustigma]|uniref:RWD domain-containing protein n=1 Tax=Chlamydomonas eustigma TaxID=1157962 RepID=A0A250X4C6_9CHLO|nr:hypothetical protein CEUSTIGMA_g5379.t1 [Chlamydomonas eustigma]|eukprot:GAX77937.1 hypothetical protein CEUSTIGMA_g5379.t1 [Chlamydomonas eustigma]
MSILLLTSHIFLVEAEADFSAVPNQANQAPTPPECHDLRNIAVLSSSKRSSMAICLMQTAGFEGTGGDMPLGSAGSLTALSPSKLYNCRPLLTNRTTRGGDLKGAAAFEAAHSARDEFHASASLSTEMVPMLCDTPAAKKDPNFSMDYHLIPNLLADQEGKHHMLNLLKSRQACPLIASLNHGTIRDRSEHDVTSPASTASSIIRRTSTSPASASDLDPDPDLDLGHSHTSDSIASSDLGVQSTSRRHLAASTGVQVVRRRALSYNKSFEVAPLGRTPLSSGDIRECSQRRPCSQFCCAPGQLAGFADFSDLYRTKSGCRLHSYSIQEAAQCLDAPEVGGARGTARQYNQAGSSSGMHWTGPHLVLIGDSMLRQLHLRLVSMARGKAASVDVGQPRNHTRYVLYADGSDYLDYGDPDEEDVLSHWVSTLPGGREAMPCSAGEPRAAAGHHHEPSKHNQYNQQVRQAGSSIRRKLLNPVGQGSQVRTLRAAEEGATGRTGNYTSCDDDSTNRSEVVIDVWFLWAPRFMDVIKAMSTLGRALEGTEAKAKEHVEASQGRNKEGHQGKFGSSEEKGCGEAGNGIDDSGAFKSQECQEGHLRGSGDGGHAIREPVVVVGVWFWHTRHSWSDSASQASWRAMLRTLSSSVAQPGPARSRSGGRFLDLQQHQDVGSAGELQSAGKSSLMTDDARESRLLRDITKQQGMTGSWVSHLVVLNTPTGRMTRAELLPHIEAMRSRNQELARWVTAQNHGLRNRAGNKQQGRGIRRVIKGVSPGSSGMAGQQRAGGTRKLSRDMGAIELRLQQALTHEVSRKQGSDQVTGTSGRRRVFFNNEERHKGADELIYNHDPILLIDFDALSVADGAPVGQIGNNWHYMCELRAVQEFMHPAQERQAGHAEVGEQVDMNELLEIEVEALKATYGYDVEVMDFEEHKQLCKIISVKIYPHTADDLSLRYVEVKLTFELPLGYPEEETASVQISQERGLGFQREAQLLQSLREEAATLLGDLVLGHLCEVAKDYLTKENYPAADCAFCLQTMATLTQGAQALRAREMDQSLHEDLNIISVQADSTKLPSSSLSSFSSAPTTIPVETTNQELLKLPCYHVFHRTCFEEWWVWRQQTWAEEETALIKHTGATSVSTILAKQLPPKEQFVESITWYIAGCPVCREPCPLDSLPAAVSGRLQVILCTEQRHLSSNGSAASPVKGKSDNLNRDRDNLEALPDRVLPSDTMAALVAVQERHKRLFEKQLKEGGIIGSQPRPGGPPESTTYEPAGLVTNEALNVLPGSCSPFERRGHAKGRHKHYSRRGRLHQHCPSVESNGAGQGTKAGTVHTQLT